MTADRDSELDDLGFEEVHGMTADRPQDATWDGHCERCDWPHHAEDGPVCRNCECMWNEKSELRARLSVVEAENARLRAQPEITDRMVEAAAACIDVTWGYYDPDGEIVLRQARSALEAALVARAVVVSPPAGSPPNE